MTEIEQQIESCIEKGGNVIFNNTRKKIKDYIYSNGYPLLIFTDGKTSQDYGLEKLVFVFPPNGAVNIFKKEVSHA